MSTPRSARLARISSPEGQLAILAVDHVSAFQTEADPDDEPSRDEQQRNLAKREIVTELASSSTAVLIDPSYRSSGSRAEIGLATSGMIIGIEDGDYADAPTNPRLLGGWSVERALAVGADAVKVSLYFEPGHDTTIAERFVADVMTECNASEMPLLCEPLVRNANPADMTAAVIEGVRRFGAFEPDVLKIQFPFDPTAPVDAARWAEACADVTEASPVPWALLSEGSDFLRFATMVEVACRSGACGFVAGRSVWRNGNDDTDRLERFQTLANLTFANAPDWRSHPS